MLPESPPDSSSEPCSPPQIPGNNHTQYTHVPMISQMTFGLCTLYENVISQYCIWHTLVLKMLKKNRLSLDLYSCSGSTQGHALSFCYSFLPPDVHVVSDVSSEQLDPGLHAPSGQTPAPFCHIKAPPSSQYDLGNSMKYIKPKSPAAAQIVCNSSLHYPYSSPPESCVQTAAPPVQHAPVDTIRGYAEAPTSSTSPCLLPYAVCMDPYVASKPGLNAGWGTCPCV